jgi:hypothetical protein
MIRPFTCICLVLAAGSGLYLYQVKQRAFALDASLRSTFHQIDAVRERTRMLRADWALMNDPERLQALASQYLKLQPMAPNQLMTMDQLAIALPPPIAPGAKPAPALDPTSTTDPTQGMPMAEAAPSVLPHANPTVPEVALLQPPTAEPKPKVDPAPQPAAPPLALAAALPLVPPPVALVVPVPPKAPVVTPPKPLHHWVRHTAPAAPTQPWLADANAAQADKQRHARHRPAPPATQFYAANEPARQQPYLPPRITPPAATVMYSQAGGSSLGMAASAALAPPRPLYSTAQ